MKKLTIGTKVKIKYNNKIAYIKEVSTGLIRNGVNYKYSYCLSDRYGKTIWAWPTDDKFTVIKR